MAEIKRNWEEVKLFIFDESFEHDVWHKRTTARLVFTVHVWYPELTEDEKNFVFNDVRSEFVTYLLTYSMDQSPS